MQLHTNAATSRDFGSFRQKLLLELGRIVAGHGARLSMPTQVPPSSSLHSCSICYSEPAVWPQSFIKYAASIGGDHASKS